MLHQRNSEIELVSDPDGTLQVTSMVDHLKLRTQVRSPEVCGSLAKVSSADDVSSGLCTDGSFCFPTWAIGNTHINTLSNNVDRFADHLPFS